MRKFAEIPVTGNAWGLAANVVRLVFDWELEGVTPEYAPGTVMAVEVTSLNPQPQPGWLYDPQTGLFTEVV